MGEGGSTWVTIIIGERTKPI